MIDPVHLNTPSTSRCHFQQRVVKIAVWGIIALVFSTNVYRAATQSITHDEALTYHSYVDAPFRHLFTHFNANNHLVNSLLCRFSTGLLGASELTMRLPVLLGGLLYLLAAYRLCGWVFSREPLFFLLAMVTLCLNPFVLDYLCVARGYGLALGLYLGGLSLLVESIEQSCRKNSAVVDSRRLVVAAICLALAVHSSLTFIVVGVASVVTFVGLVLVNGHTTLDEVQRRRLRQQLRKRFLNPGLTVFGLLAIPLIKARPSHFYVGAETLTVSLRSLVEASFAHHRTIWPWDTAGEAFERLLLLLSTWGIGAAALAIGCLSCYLILRLKASGWQLVAFSPEARLILLLGPTLLLTCITIVLVHTSFGVLYPMGRTGVFIVPVFTLCIVSALRYSIRARPIWMTIAAPGFAMSVLVICQFALQFPTSSFQTWRYDKATKQVFDVIRRQLVRRARPVRVASHWLFLPSLEFYRKQHGATWMAISTSNPGDGPYDCYVHPISEPIVSEQVTRIFRDAESGTTVDIPQTRSEKNRAERLSDTAAINTSSSHR